jgi:hypothetical protein
MGDCRIGWDAHERAHSILQLHTGAALYVVGDLFVGSLLVADGAEVHCGGTLTVPARLAVDTGGFCSAATVVRAAH